MPSIAMTDNPTQNDVCKKKKKIVFIGLHIYS